MAAYTQQGVPAEVISRTSAGEVDSRVPEQASRSHGAQPATASSVVSGFGPELDSFERAREAAGWGSRFKPPIDHDKYASYRRICDDLNSEVATLTDFLVDGTVTEEASGVVAEIESDLERLYDCHWGEGESLKRAVIAIQSQINNARWTAKHVDFLRSAVSFLRPRYLVNDLAVDELNQMIEQHGLDQFRGSVSDSEVATRYRIERIH